MGVGDGDGDGDGDGQTDRQTDRQLSYNSTLSHRKTRATYLLTFGQRFLYVKICSCCLFTAFILGHACVPASVSVTHMDESQVSAGQHEHAVTGYQIFAILQPRDRTTT